MISFPVQSTSSEGEPFGDLLMGEESDLCRPGTSSGTWRDPHYLDAAPQRLNSWVKLLRAYRTRRDIIKLYRRCTKPRPDPTRRMFPSSWTLNSKQDGPSSTLMLLRSRTGLPRYFPVSLLQRTGSLKHSIAMMKALPDIFPSPVAPPKKLGHASEAMLHILESAEDPNTFLQERLLFSPVVIICETNCVLAIGTMPVVTFPKEDIYASVTYLKHDVQE
ncbi:uncharacterized protein LOC115161028 isoform X1 [Salmo trutta]|uniref:uncharacterized protein LOC115160798 isoform X1 n=1 Tax=Salmo trutta TaxID=8032 RepID=UPI001130E00E|nr:uncharacterized protein LOC115160798 isoform X1 [Salmo trutta]XP_029567093.1 uncharacterized protein LOC115160798 isoform X1 [Salmo trutta]XP_029567102.1 uncharacterized protein LOC115160798 isoform X1 [Salmo trutta]XP_029567125.1 uncharacterized protein LOC115160810 isoform X1 [Salmo trutta]XP_029567564.1 uncharacterized protein LOC115161028 isoform X1 [Salmo trutta]XP_029567572.1 uncharacterized protein LOC115161028 isoform X1 [Salmo trutta]